MQEDHGKKKWSYKYLFLDSYVIFDHYRLISLQKPSNLNRPGSEMIRQGLVHSRGFDNSTMNNPLPPLNTLPQWSRINAFDKVSCLMHINEVV